MTNGKLTSEETRTAEIVGTAVRLSEDQSKRAPDFLLDFIVELSKEHGGAADRELADAAGVSLGRFGGWLLEGERRNARRDAAVADSHPCVRAQAKVLRFAPIAPRKGAPI